jgi:hypothetical protein
MKTETLTESIVTEWHNKGAVKIPQLLDSAELSACREFYDWILANPSPVATQFFEGEADAFFNDVGQAAGYYPRAESLFVACPSIRATVQSLFGADNQNIWFLGYEVFHKRAGAGRHTPFHQDASFAPFHGKHLVRFWIPFERTPKSHCLEVMGGSHRGPLFNPNKILMTDPATHAADGVDDTTPCFDKEEELRAMPRVPDILADPEAYDVLSWDLDPGDAVAFHLASLHGNAPVDARHPERNTLILGFFGDDCIYKPLPVEGMGDFLDPAAFSGLKEGDHFSLSGSEAGSKRIRLQGSVIKTERVSISQY